MANTYLPLTLFLLLGLVSCGTSSQLNNSHSSSQDTGSHSTFFGVVLQQFDEVGRPLWTVRAKQAKYAKEKEIAQAESPYGELYQDGKVVYQIKAEKADIKQDGKELFLKGKILATDPHNGIVLQGNELEWRPKEDLLIVRNHINGVHKQLQAIAQEARVKTRDQIMEFSGKVVANSTDPPVQIHTEHLIWQIKKNLLISNSPVQIYHYKNTQVIDYGSGKTAQVNLKTKICTIKQNAQIELLDPPMQIASNSINWNVNTEIATSNSPIRAFHRAENITVTANQGEIKILLKTAYFVGNANAVGQRHQFLKSNTLTWYLDKKLLQAKGNVFYKQIDPQLNFTGETATGNLETEHIVVKSGGAGDRVVTVVIPQDVKGK